MNELEKARARIDDIDRINAELFAARMEYSAKTALYKRDRGLDVKDPLREAEVISTRVSAYPDDASKKFYRENVLNTLALSKKYQRSLLRGENEVFVCTGEDGYTVTIKRGALSELENYIKNSGKILVVTDSGVPKQHVDACVNSLCGCDTLVLPHGENNKNRNNLFRIIDRLYESGFTRTDSIVALGGGVVGDTAGFAASIYNRGISFYNIPTTLLSQVDSSVGGKVGVDHRGGKNLIGAFYDPKAVIIDPDVLKTLDRRQIANGMAEIIKISVTCDKDLFELLESGAQNGNIETIIKRAVELKAAIVENDRKESSLRRVLNFGHTVGHAIESCKGLGNMLHGECVALGMIPMCSEKVRGRLVRLLKDCGLPTECDIDANELAKYIALDKKRSGGMINIVTSDEIGTYSLIEKPMDEFVLLLDELVSVIRRKI
ncbi:MAG: 3-dehydroquinate synthase [Clostridia bacterium]|nr:3-dehydroquinate synthase [Clostridia bacterium]